jgi:hypothetical protein
MIFGRSGGVLCERMNHENIPIEVEVAYDCAAIGGVTR